MTLAFCLPVFSTQNGGAASTCRSINKAAERDRINHVLIKSYDKCVKKSRDCVYHPRISDKILGTSFDECAERDRGSEAKSLGQQIHFLVLSASACPELTLLAACPRPLPLLQVSAVGGNKSRRGQTTMK